VPGKSFRIELRIFAASSTGFICVDKKVTAELGLPANTKALGWIDCFGASGLCREQDKPRSETAKAIKSVKIRFFPFNAVLRAAQQLKSEQHGFVIWLIYIGKRHYEYLQ
jgi:hypothetical protein